MGAGHRPAPVAWGLRRDAGTVNPAADAARHRGRAGEGQDGAGAGALLLFGSPLHWGAKSLSLIVGLALGAASVIALLDSDDVFGIFAANGLTKLVWGVAAAVLLVLALLPGVGARTHDPDADWDQRRHETRGVKRPPRTVKREPDRIRFDRGSRATTDQSEAGNRVAVPGSGRTPASP